MTNIKCIWLLFFFYWFFCSASEQTVQTNQHVHTSCSGKHNFAITWERWVTVFIFAYTFFFLVAEILFIKFALKSDELKVWTTSHIQTHLWALTHYISGEKKKSFACIAQCAWKQTKTKNEEFGWIESIWRNGVVETGNPEVKFEIFMMLNGRRNVETRTRRHTFSVWIRRTYSHDKPTDDQHFKHKIHHFSFFGFRREIWKKKKKTK